MTSAVQPRQARRRSFSASTRRLASRVVTSAWILFLLAATAAVATLGVLYRGDAEGSARRANEEIDRLLVRGEEVEQRAAVMQRHWWDHFRVTHGILAATDRRLLFVGVPPAPLLPREYEPPEQLEVSIPYESSVRARAERQFLGTVAGVRLTAGEPPTTVRFATSEPARVDSVLAVLARRQAALRQASEAERRAAEATAAASRRAIYHLVQPGEALDLIARRYGVSVDSVIAWNRLPSSRITAGRRLLVKPETP